MIKIIISYDDNDSELGEYFEESFNTINSVFTSTNNFTVHSISGLNCDESNIINITNQCNDNSYIFIGLSHGNEKQLLTSNCVYVDCENIGHFKNSLFYSPACSTAAYLGNKLIENSCLCFIGYFQDTWATYDNFYPIYIKCENYCINEFINSNKSIETSFNEMLDYFDEQIDAHSNYDDILVAMELQHNKDCFALLGNTTLKRSDFEHLVR